MQSSISLCMTHNMNPFYLFDREIDEVIMLINFYIEKAQDKEETENNKLNSREDDNKSFWSNI